MNREFFRYKTSCITFVLLLAYAYMHVKLTGVYVDADLHQLIDFSARLPYGQRILIPAIAHVFQAVLPLNVEELFFLLELLSISLFFWALRTLLAHAFSTNTALFLSWLFMLLLPLMSIINYRLTTGGNATFFYPADSASLLFMTAGFLLCLEARWTWYYLLIFLATCNRESSVLLILLIPALHWKEGRGIVKPILLAMLAYVLARWMVLTALDSLPGGVFEWYFRASEHTLFEANTTWLIDENHLLLFAFCLSGLPIFWFAFYDYIPPKYRPIRYLAFLYFLGLLLVGNFAEARIFTELLVVLYVPICLAVHRWLIGEPAYEPVLKTWLHYVDRYIIIGSCALIVVFRRALNMGVIWLLQHFHMGTLT